MESDSLNKGFARFAENMTDDLSAAAEPGSAPVNIEGEVFEACLFCAGCHFAENEYLFIDLKQTVDFQKT
eukprot:5336089-Prorocentrum_lima.AAC.1